MERLNCSSRSLSRRAPHGPVGEAGGLQCLAGGQGALAAAADQHWAAVASFAATAAAMPPLGEVVGIGTQGMCLHPGGRPTQTIPISTRTSTNSVSGRFGAGPRPPWGAVFLASCAVQANRVAPKIAGNDTHRSTPAAVGSCSGNSFAQRASPSSTAPWAPQDPAPAERWPQVSSVSASSTSRATSCSATTSCRA